MTALPKLRGSLYIAGRWCEADSCRTVDVINPATEQVLCQVASCGRAEANSMDYGLASYVATRDLRTALKAAEAIEAGIVSIGDFSPATVLSPFGGIKQSGIGREGGREGILEYVESKAISLCLEE